MLVKEILNDIINDFDITKFSRFFREKSKKFKPAEQDLSQYNNDDFSEGMMLGEIDLDDDSQIIICAFKVNKELTERSGKKAQYILGKKILKETARYAAGIFIFYDENSNFRFSLIYDIPKPGAKRDWSSFRRFTYFVSKELTNKTFLIQMEAADFSLLDNIIDAFSVEKVTKEFYQEIANWYFWAVKNVKFPDDAENETNGRNIAVIRLITRLIFIWFMKAKGLIGDHLFNPNNLEVYLKDLKPNSKDSAFYNAILQNLFFATLNTKIEDRKFRREHAFQGKNKDYMAHNYYRHHSLFKNPEDMLNIFKGIPFLNGGLFECFDKSKDDPTNETGKEIRIDGFSDKEANQPIVPNFLFFSGEQKVDLQKDYGADKYKNAKVKGIINILQSYNFTIDENTPTDEEVALDPELLGKVLENLLASYNPVTATTARKSTGSYYTPREIVNYMVDESLIAYLINKVIEGAKSYIELGTNQSDIFGNSARKGQLKIEEELLPSRWINNEDKLEDELRKLISYTEDSISFTDKETDILINAINNCKILDPAVGSGAFPMGVLHKLVLILSKLDPHNIKWKQKQISAIESNVTDPGLKKVLLKKIEDNFSRNELDYGRKLYLIQNCLYGVDIQPIAIQIAKLRFFISLLVDEKIQSNDDNYGIEPLPNLETKLVAANTLIGLTYDTTFKPKELDELEEELFVLRKKYFTANEEKEKRKIEKKDRELRLQIKSVLQENRFPAEYSEKISNWDPYDTNKSSDWFDQEWMFGPDLKNGFDIVIGNPPYVRADNPLVASLRKQIMKSNQYNTLYEKWDLMVPFYEKCLRILNKNGVNAFIASNSITTSKFSYRLQDLIIKKYKVCSIDYFEDDMQIFDAGVVPVVTIIKKTEKDVIPKKIYRSSEFLNIDRIIEVDTSDLTNLRERIFKKSFSTLFYPIVKTDLLGDICYLSKGMVMNSDENEAKGEFSKDDLISELKDKIHSKSYN